MWLGFTAGCTVVTAQAKPPRITFSHTFSRKLCTQLEVNPGRTAYFGKISPILDQWLGSASAATVADGNIDLIQRLCQTVRLSRKFIRSSAIRAGGVPSGKLLNIIRVNSIYLTTSRRIHA